MYKEMSIEELSEKFVNNLVETNRGFNFYVDWNNAMDYKQFEIELNALNVLIKCENIHDKFVELIKKVPTVVATFPLLFALSKVERKNVWTGKNEPGQKDYPKADVLKSQDHYPMPSQEQNFHPARRHLHYTFRRYAEMQCQIHPYQRFLHLQLR